MKTKQTTTELIEEIHHEFETAGDKLLSDATKLLSPASDFILNKSNRLENIGFKSSPEIRRAEPIRVNKELAELIAYYKFMYPNNKFITEDQVISICDKYNLVCGPVERFKGFVPESKLSDIESFRINKKDVAVDHFIVKSCWNNDIFLFRGLCASVTHKRLGLKTIPVDHPNIRMHGNTPFAIYDGVSGITYVESFKRVDKTSMRICAPKKDFNLTGLQKMGKIFSIVTGEITVPDPVVLHPVRGGYLILAAWGDEASDPIVVNESQN